ncbi:MAG: hypothetical protein IJW24_00095, partial [Clostridia bacterium]|nr:hypothetical protein [Clostridia bacterium]
MGRISKNKRLIILSSVVAFIAAIIFMVSFLSVKNNNREDIPALTVEEVSESEESTISVSIADTNFSGTGILLLVKPNVNVEMDNCNITGSALGAITVNGGTLNLKNSSIDFIEGAEAITGDGGAISVNGGTLNLDNTNISGYKVTGNGGAIYAHSTSVLNINGGSFSDCEAAYGGAICLKSSTLDINGTTFDSNKSSHSGGAIYSELSTINIGQDENAALTSFTGHESMYYGGAICSRVTELHVANASFTNNELLNKNVNSMGGGIYQAGGEAYIADTTFTGNIAGNRGGAYYAGGYVEFLGDTNFIENKADGSSGEAGAVMFAANGFIGRADRSFDGEFRGNVSNGGGGAIYLSNNAEVHQYGGTIIGNSSNNAQGGGIYLYTGAKYFLQDGEIADNFVNNSSNGYGGGIYINKSDAVFTMYLGEVSGNSAELAGGGVYVNEGQFVLRGGSIFDNTAGVLGGGICVKNTTNTQALNISAGEIYSNTAGSYGGGIYLQNREYDTIDSEGAKATEKIHIENVNIYSNTASYGGGIASGSGNLDLYAGVVVNENTATTCGDGVYLRNGVSFVLCGGQVYDSDNAIFAEGNTNTITLNSGKLGSKQVVEDDVVSYNAIKTNATVPIVTIFQDNTNLELEGVYINNELVTVSTSTVYLEEVSCFVDGGSLTLVDSLIEATQRVGVYVDGGTLTLLGNTTFDVVNGYCIRTVGSSSKRSTINLGTKIETINDVEVADFDGYCHNQINLEYADLKMYGGCIDSGYNAIKISYSNVYIYGGVISSSSDSVCCFNPYSNFYLEGGTIKSLGGCGIYATAGNFFLNGGEINDCSSKGIYASNANVNLTGTSILNNSIGVNLTSSTFNMSGGKISGNTASNGAGVTIRSSTMTMTGGEISGNTASVSGGGIYADDSSTLNLQSNAIISGNSSNSGNGGGVCLVDSTLNMSGGKISDNHASSSGGGLYLSSSETSTISGGQVINNTSYTGAGIFTAAPLDIYGNAVIAKNTASGDGGGLSVSGKTVNIGKTQNFTGAIAENYGSLGGGVHVSGTNSNVYHYSGVIGENTVDGVTYTGNNASSGAGVGLYTSSKFTLCGGKIYKNILSGGGAICVSDSNAEVIITSGEICENAALDGYTLSGTAIRINSGTLTMEGGTIHSHTSYYGAVYCSGTFNMTGGEIKNNTSVNGGGVFLNGASSILNMSSNAKIEANTATTNGGGVFLNGAGSTLNISSNAKIETNIANNGGGGVYVLKGTLNVDGGSISNNKIKTIAADKSVYGAGICATSAVVSMTDGLVSNNILHSESLSGATLAGAGIYGTTGTHILLSGGKISENIANGFGGGIHLSFNSYTSNGTTIYSYLEITGGEITLNQAESGAGVYMNGGDTFAENTATAKILGGNVHDNTAVLSGGGLELARVTSVFDGNNNIYSNKINETVNHEENSGYGAGVAINGGKASIYNGTINANTVVYSSNLDAAFGAGLYITGTAEVTLGKYENSEEYKPTISHNIASPYSTGTTAFNKSSGGNIFINRDATLIIKNAEILGDGTTMQSQLGGAIANLGVLRMLGGTISGCVATTGGGIGSYGGFEIDVNVGSLSLNYDLTRNDLEISGNSKILDCVASNVGSSVAMGNKVTFGDGEVEINGTIAIGATEKSTFLGLYEIVPATYPQITVHPNFDLVNHLDLVFAQASFDYGNQTYSMQAKDTMMVSKFVDKDVLFITGSHNHIISEFNLTRANTYFEYYSDSTLANHTGYSLGT